MKKFMKVMAIVLALALTAALSIGLTLAYLTDQDEAVNVMTFGNVDIKQHEYERVLNADGTYETVTVTKADGSTQLSYKVKEFTQAKPLYPAVGTNTGYDSTYVRWEQLGDATKVSGGQQVLAGLNNIQDKFVLVENTGKSDAYVRTVFAFELGSKTIEEFNKLVKTAFGSDPEPWDGRGIDGAVEIDGNRYAVMEYIYTGYSYGNMRHQGGILPAGEWTYNNLAQIYLVSEATNEDCIELDGNGNGTYEILVVSQAVQTEGFSDAKTALDTAFGEITATNHPWSDGVPALSWDGSADTDWYNAENTEFVITTADQLAGLAEMVNAGNTFKGKTVKLAADINLGNMTWTPIGQNGDKDGFQGTFDGQGNTISNLYVDLSDRAYQSAGLFGSARFATIKNFKVVNATVKNMDDAGNTSNGAAVVVGAAQFATTIDNVDVENATVIGNRRVSAIAGYYVGTITNCDVNNVELIATFDELADGGYDNCDKVGGIIAYSNGASTITNNTVKNAKISGYRDIGGIAGYATSSTLTGNKVENVDFTILKSYDYKNYATVAEHDVNAIIGEGTADDTNTAENVTIVTSKAVSSADELSAAISESDGAVTLSLAAGTYRMPSVTGAKEFTISGTKDTVIDLIWGAYMDSSKVSFEGVTIKTGTGYTTSNGTTFGSDYAALYSPNVTYTDCTFVGPMRVGRDGATFIDCTFTNLGNDYVWTYGNDCTFIGCTFESDGKALLIYSDGGAEVSKVVVKGCVFNASASAKAGAISNQPCAAIEIQNYGNGVNLTTGGNTIDTEFSGEWRIKTYHAGRPAVIVNGTEYTSVALDGKALKMFGSNALALSDASFASIVTNRNNAATISSIEVYTAQDLKTVNEMIHSGLMCYNGVNDIHAKIIFKDDIDFGGADWKAITKNIDIAGNGYTWSNVNFLPNANGQAGIYSYSGNCLVDSLTLKNITAAGSQAGAFAGNATNTHLTNCALAGTITINWTATSDPYNGVGAVFGVTSGATNTVGVDVSNATIVINKTGVTYPDGFSENAENLVGVIYGGSYTK